MRLTDIANAVATKYNLNTTEISKSVPVINPIPVTNCSFKGTEALAAYNYSIAHKDEIFNLPTIAPLLIETNIDKIEGEKIYNSEGKLLRIVNDEGNKKEIFHIENDNISYYEREDKISGTKWSMHFWDESITVNKSNANGTTYSTTYGEGKILERTQRKNTKNGDIEVVYDTKNKEYHISKHYTKNGDKYNSFAIYDENKKCTRAFESKGLHDKCTELFFKNGIPYNMETTESKGFSETAGKEDLDLRNLKPDKPVKINFEKIKNLAGKKKYYSNGQIEQIITPKGTIYEFDLDDSIFVKHGNKEYHYYLNKEDGSYAWSVLTDLGNGQTKRTDSWKDSNRIIVSIEKDGEVIKKACYNENGTLNSYQDYEAEIIRDFDKSGNLVGIWDKTNT